VFDFFDILGAISDFSTEELLQEGQLTRFFFFCFSNSLEESNQPSKSDKQLTQFNLYTIINNSLIF